ncbi:acid phosphatase 1-like [Canna indica]|uniref:Acid phosphatase 1-like n=1 Tax=Canna indica TaxID=4628 RepID=A0AAQ3JP51_9LILI|nr:acid phosphatase 1-like [Canna indica]
MGKALAQGRRCGGQRCGIQNFKSSERAKLVESGLRIVGNIGDQWSDILGSPEGDRTFKLPDPMYYIS